MSRIYVYALTDPRDSSVNYVGASKNPSRRLVGHLSAKGRLDPTLPVSAWLRDLVSDGIKPCVRILEETDAASWAEAESRWIAAFRADGAPLKNVCLGGPGAPGLNHTPDTRRRMSASRLGKPVSIETRMKLSVAKTGTPGIPLTPEQRARMEAGRRIVGWSVSESTRKKISATLKGRIPSDGERARCSAGVKRSWLSRGANSNSSTGVRGVHWRNDIQKYRVKKTVGGKRITLGHTTTLEEAVALLKEVADV